MSNSIAIVDYGMGNIRSILNALREVGSDGELISNPSDIARRSKLILPGVGAFGEAMNNLRQSGVDEALEKARQAGASVLGICLGMQLMFSVSEEGGVHQGLDWIKGRVIRFPDQPDLRVPHMGWNELTFTRNHDLTVDVGDGSDVYFLHSFHCACEHPEDVLATSDYGLRFTAMFAHDNLYGIQFHPEKSQHPGLTMLRNFAQM
ncbi:MAG: imidazole glycerol phosphate synthase subunit HisH [Betaproteobacteria bacterium]|nr:imidazole glycerol phosphate synthase subunit HisH [Betaproteobacteria bacterium]